MIVTDEMQARADRRDEFRRELASLLNRYSMENGSNTPDFMLADYLIQCLRALDGTLQDRDKWYGVTLIPGRTATNEEAHLRMQIGYIVAELQKRGDPRSTPEIVETAAKATAAN